MEIIVNKNLFLKRKVGVTERPRSLNSSKAVAMAICPILVHFITWHSRSMYDVACEFARAAVRSKDAQKQLAQTSLISTTVTKMACVFQRRSIDVINKVVTAVSHLDVDGPHTTV